MAIATSTLIVGALSLAGTLYSQSENRSAASASRGESRRASNIQVKQAEAQRRSEELKASRARIATAREGRKMRAANVNRAGAMGIESSGATGAAGSVMSQTAGSIGFSQTQSATAGSIFEMGKQASGFLQSAADQRPSSFSQGVGAFAQQGLSSAASSIFSQAGTVFQNKTS